MANATYSPAVFDVPDEAAARRIILTREYEQDTAERWERETPYLTDLFASQIRLSPESLVIDYGCGVGRLSKALIARFGCRVLGVDLSEQMRALAPGYVGSPLFSVVSPPVFQMLGLRGLQASAALSVWVLQHCQNPDLDVGLLAAAMRPDAPFFLVNNVGRALPTQEGRWATDGVDIRNVVAARFEARADGKLDPAVVPPRLSHNSFWATYVRR